MPTKKQIKQTIKEEYVKCAFDPAYFMREYCYIQHPIRGKIKFDLYYSEQSVMAKYINDIIKAIDVSGLDFQDVKSVLADWNLSTHPENREAALAILSTKPFLQFQYRNMDDAILLEHTENEINNTDIFSNNNIYNDTTKVSETIDPIYDVSSLSDKNNVLITDVGSWYRNPITSKAKRTIKV